MDDATELLNINDKTKNYTINVKLDEENISKVQELFKQDKIFVKRVAKNNVEYDMNIKCRNSISFPVIIIQRNCISINEILSHINCFSYHKLYGKRTGTFLHGA